MFSSLSNECPSTDKEAILSTLAAMCVQEDHGYVKRDYLCQSQGYDVDTDCRTKMVQWCYQVIDFCKFQRSTVETAMSYFDRFLSTQVGTIALRDRSIFQLACMTCLYTAVKIHEPTAMDPKLVSVLSRGVYTEEEIVAMESTVLAAIQWRMNPPTSSDFVALLLDLIPECSENQQFHDIVQSLAKMQIELSIANYDFVTIKASVLAFCSVMNSLESLNVFDKLILNRIECRLGQAITLDTQIYDDSKMIKLVQQVLCEECVMHHSQQNQEQADHYSNTVSVKSSSSNHNDSCKMIKNSRRVSLDTSSHTAIF